MSDHAPLTRSTLFTAKQSPIHAAYRSRRRLHLQEFWMFSINAEDQTFNRADDEDTSVCKRLYPRTIFAKERSDYGGKRMRSEVAFQASSPMIASSRDFPHPRVGDVIAR